jgi:nucleoside-diphosphate-sugar epimerase
MESIEGARVLVAGAGYVGCALAARLAHEGSTVWGLRRSPEGLPRGVRPFTADLRVPQTLAQLPADLDFVFYTAAPDHGDEAGYRSAYVDGLRNLLTVLESRGERPRRIVFTSSTAVYAQSGGEWVDEASPVEPVGFAGRVLLEAEQLLLAARFPATVLRLGGIYGPRRSRLLDRVAEGTATCPPGEARWSNRIHLADCAGVLRHIIEVRQPADLYLGVDREPAPLCEIVRWIARQLGRPAPPVAPAARGSPASGRAPTNKRCSSARLVASGYSFRFPSYREGFAPLIAQRLQPPPAP